MNLQVTDSIKNNPVQLTFSKAKLTYDKHSEVQIDVGEKLIEIATKSCNRFKSVIDIGCGTGLTTKKLLNEIKYTQFDALDFSKNFLDEAKAKKLPHNITYLHHNFDQYFKDQTTKYDFVFASMSMQWSANFNSLLDLIYSSLTPSGQLIFSIPLTNTFHEINADCHINNFYSLNQIINILQNTGFNLEISKSKSYTLFFDSPIKRLQSIKQTGANCYKGKRYKANFHKLRAISRQLTEKKFPLTYEIGLFKASKKVMI